MPSALIFGIDGQDGSYLAEFLLERDYQVIGWLPQQVESDLNRIQHLLRKLTLVSGDLSRQAELLALVDGYRPDELYNLAAPSFPAGSWQDPVLVGDIAGLGVVRLLEAVRQVHPAARFYQASTSELFGEPLEVPQNENTPFRPRNPYGIAKLYAHWSTVRYRQQYSLHTVSGILYNHESPRRGLEFVTRKITHGAARIKLGLQAELHLGDLQARRDWGFAGDYVRAMWAMLQHNPPDDYVIGSGQTHSVRQLCELAFGCLDLDYHDYVVQDPSFMRPPEHAQLVADPRRAHAELGWQPQVSFPELVRMMVEADLSELRSAA